jgi:4-hydroxy-tetrahydrodipicolinate synthase
MGVISVLSNLYPERVSKICSDYFIGKRESSRRAQLDAFGLSRVMFVDTNPSPIKYAMSLAGLCDEEVRLPLWVPSDEAKLEIKRELDLYNKI